MNNNFRRNLLALSFFGVMSFMVSPSAQAQDIAGLLKQILETTRETTKHIITILASMQAFGEELGKALLEPTPDIDSTANGNINIAEARETARTDHFDPLIGKAVDTLLTTTAAKQPGHLIQITSLPGPDFPEYTRFKILPMTTINLPNANKPEEPSPFNIDSLTGKVSFKEGSEENSCQSKPEKSTGQQQKPLCRSYAAQSVVSYLSGLSNPPVVPAFAEKIKSLSNDQIKDFRESPQVQTYLASLRAYTAAQSVGLNNLYQLYAERVIQEGLGEKLNVRKPSTIGPDGKVVQGDVIKDVSPLQAEEYMAKRRIDDPNWYKQIEESTSPQTIARETLYLLAEIRLEMYKNRMQMEQLITTMSTLQLSSLQNAKTLLDQAAGTIVFPESAQASRTQTPESPTPVTPPQQQQQQAPQFTPPPTPPAGR